MNETLDFNIEDIGEQSRAMLCMDEGGCCCSCCCCCCCCCSGECDEMRELN